MTKDGVEYDLSVSPYRFNVIYNGVSMLYVFSSVLYMRKFSEQHIKNQENSIKSNIDLTLLSDIKDYKNIEKRGFLVLKNSLQPFNSVEKLTIKTVFDIV